MQVVGGIEANGNFALRVARGARGARGADAHVRLQVTAKQLREAAQFGGGPVASAVGWGASGLSLSIGWACILCDALGFSDGESAVDDLACGVEHQAFVGHGKQCAGMA